MDRNAICERLALQPLFQGLAPAALADVAQYVRPQQYAPERTIVWQGEASTSVFLMVGGLAVVTHLDGEGQSSHILAYLMPGASFGEVGILEQQPRSATVRALTEVELLELNRADFLVILQRYPAVAIALARRLGQALVDADRRYHQEINPTRLILIFDLSDSGAGATLFGHALATHLERQTAAATALLVYPTLGSSASESRFIPPAAGYERLVPGTATTLPPAVEATLLADRIARRYDNAVVVLPGLMDAASMVWLRQAQHAVLWAASTTRGQEQLGQVQRHLAQYIASGQVGVSVVIVAQPGERLGLPGELGADYIVRLPELSQLGATDAEPALSAEIEQVVMTLIERLDHTHQIALYIPTTIAVDHAADTSDYVERTLAFFGARFGGATSSPARGVWQSQAAGLVQEAVHLVQTYATAEDLHRFLPEVLAYVKALKVELQQEAMALEINHQLMLL